MSTAILYTVQVTSEEMALLERHRELGPHKIGSEEVVQAVAEALRQPHVALLLERWENGVIFLKIEFENKRVKYVTPKVEGPRLKAGRDI